METIELAYAGPLADGWPLGVGEGVIVIDRHRTIRSANAAVEQLLGYEPGQLCGAPLTQVWASPGRPTTNGQTAALAPAILTHQEGHPIPVALAITALDIGQEGDCLISVVGPQETEGVNETLLHVQRLAGVGTLTASVAHELSSPLSIITGLIANLRADLDSGELDAKTVTRSLDLMEQSAHHGARIINVLRHYTHNDGHLTLAITSASSIIEDALTLVAQQFRKQAYVEIETAISPGMETLVCDHNRITQVLINLLLNARDALQPGGGKVRVRFWTLANENGRDEVVFSVANNGPAIAPEVLDRLFEPFFTTKPVGSGTGLGLFIAQNIVAQHNGRIMAENMPGGGVIFTVVLPRRP